MSNVHFASSDDLNSPRTETTQRTLFVSKIYLLFFVFILKVQVVSGAFVRHVLSLVRKLVLNRSSDMLGIAQEFRTVGLFFFATEFLPTSLGVLFGSAAIPFFRKAFFRTRKPTPDQLPAGCGISYAAMV